jgi:hypothetical protein
MYSGFQFNGYGTGFGGCALLGYGFGGRGFGGCPLLEHVAPCVGCSLLEHAAPCVDADLALAFACCFPEDDLR